MERDKMDTSLNLNSNQSQKAPQKEVETAGTLAQATEKLFIQQNNDDMVETAGTIANNTPSPLFKTQTETAGTIACNNTSSNSGGGGSLSALG